MAVERERKRVGYIVISSDRGLCGGLNSNLFRKLALRRSGSSARRASSPSSAPSAPRRSAFFRRFGGKVLAQATHLGDKPHVEDLIGTVKVMLDAFEASEIDAIYIATTSSSTP